LDLYKAAESAHVFAGEGGEEIMNELGDIQTYKYIYTYICDSYQE